MGIFTDGDDEDDELFDMYMLIWHHSLLEISARSDGKTKSQD